VVAELEHIDEVAFSVLQLFVAVVVIVT